MKLSRDDKSVTAVPPSLCLAPLHLDDNGVGRALLKPLQGGLQKIRHKIFSPDISLSACPVLLTLPVNAFHYFLHYSMIEWVVNH